MMYFYIISPIVVGVVVMLYVTFNGSKDKLTDFVGAGTLFLIMFGLSLLMYGSLAPTRRAEEERALKLELLHLCHNETKDLKYCLELVNNNKIEL